MMYSQKPNVEKSDKSDKSREVEISVQTQSAQSKTSNVRSKNNSQSSFSAGDRLLRRKVDNQYSILKIHSATPYSATPVNFETDVPANELHRSGSEQSLSNRNPNSNPDEKYQSNVGRMENTIKPFASESNLSNEQTWENGAVLSSAHPLMKRYHRIVADHLQKQKEQLLTERKQTQDIAKQRKEEYERLAADAVAAQQELDKLRRLVEEKDKNYQLFHEQRVMFEEQSAELNEKMLIIGSRIEELQKSDKAMKEELRAIDSQINRFVSDVMISDHMKIAQNAIKKTQQDLLSVEKGKAKQDEVTARLLAEVDRVEEEAKATVQEIQHVSTEIAEKRERQTVVNAEIQSVAAEKRALLQSWNTTLAALRVREDELATIRTTISNCKYNSVTLDGELKAMQKSLANAKAANEQFSNELSSLEKTIERSNQMTDSTISNVNEARAELEAMKKALETAQTESTDLTKEKANLESTLNNLTTKIRLDRKELTRIEDGFLVSNTNDLTATVLLKELDKVRIRNNDLEKSCDNLETELAQLSAGWSEIESSIQLIKKSSEEYRSSTDQLRNTTDKLKQDMQRQQGVLQQRQSQVEKLAGKINLDTKTFKKTATENEGASQVQKKIYAIDDRIGKLQKDWLILQEQLVMVSESLEKENNSVCQSLASQDQLNHLRVILKGDIESNEEETSRLNRDLEMLHWRINKINERIAEKIGTKSALENDFRNAHDFLSEKLQKAEMDVIQWQEKLSNAAKERENAQKALDESGRELALWEQKIAAARNDRQAISSIQENDDVNQLIADIHRMQIRFGQLNKKKETISKELEKAVSKRDTLLQKGDAVGAAKTIRMTRAQLEQTVVDMRRRVKQFQKDLVVAEQEAEEHGKKTAECQRETASKRENFETVSKTLDELQGQLGSLENIYFKNSNVLAISQLCHKYFEDAKDGKYEPLCGDTSQLEMKRLNEAEKRDQLLAVLNHILSTYPHLLFEVKKIEGLITD